MVVKVDEGGGCGGENWEEKKMVERMVKMEMVEEERDGGAWGLSLAVVELAEKGPMLGVRWSPFDGGREWM